ESAQFPDAAVDRGTKHSEITGIDRPRESTALVRSDESGRLGQIIQGRRGVGNAGRQWAGNVHQDDIGALGAQSLGVRPALARAAPVTSATLPISRSAIDVNPPR